MYMYVLVTIARSTAGHIAFFSDAQCPTSLLVRASMTSGPCYNLALSWHRAGLIEVLSTVGPLVIVARKRL